MLQSNQLYKQDESVKDHTALGDTWQVHVGDYECMHGCKGGKVSQS
jgi:hypothetical protein